MGLEFFAALGGFGLSLIEAAHAHLHAFENTFFSLLKLHNSTFETINEHHEAEGSTPAGSILQRLMAQARSQDTLEAARGVDGGPQ